MWQQVTIILSLPQRRPWSPPSLQFPLDLLSLFKGSAVPLVPSTNMSLPQLYVLTVLRTHSREERDVEGGDPHGLGLEF